MADIYSLKPNLRDRYAKSPENGVEMCLFPTLVDAAPGKARRMARCVPGEHLSDFGTLYKRDRSDLASLLVAAWSIVLHQFVNSEVLYFGVDAPREMSGSVSGDFKTFVVTIDPDDLIEQLLQTCHRQLSMSQDESGNIHFNTGVVFMAGESESSFRLGSSSEQLYATDNEDYDLLLIARTCNGMVEILLHYSTAVVSDSQAAIIGGVLSRSIESMLEHPDQKLRDINLLDQQSQECVAEWNNKQTNITTGSSIAEIIQEKSRYQPGAPAVCSWDGTLTYGELEELSTTLSIHLKEKGVGPEVMVPVCFEKTMWAIVATLAVVKAGAAFVPIDPSHPLEYLKQIITRVDAKVILSSDRQATLLEGVIDDLIVVSGSTAARLPTVNPMALLRGQVETHNMACVLFTSGSTGSPKGCVISHGALAAVATYAEALEMKANTRALQFASFSFAISLNEIFCTLTVGGTICIPSGHERMNDLSGAMSRMGVSWAMLTPSLMGSLAPDNVACLKTLIVGGEPLRSDLARSWAERISVVPAYGMTEWVGVCTVQQELEIILPEADSNLKNIGKSPVANLWLVNPHNHHVLAPIGAVAELLIEGPCLARGYINDAERTAMAFIENPLWLRFFRSDREARLYKTGDLVRYSSDGSLIYMGRKGLQTKIRGQRIELGEVEHQVFRHFPGATKVIVDVVTPIGDTPSPILVAFILCSKNARDGAPAKKNLNNSNSAALFDGSDHDFQSHSAEAETKIRDLLPDYMIPHVYVPLEYVPLTISGKVDRRKLKEIAGSLSYGTLASYAFTRLDPVTPSSRAEQRLHLLLSKILKLPSESFGVNESFFRLGGDSLKAIQLVTQCRAEGITITVEDIFREKTVSSLALLVGAHCSTVTRHDGDSEAEFSLTPVQRSMILAEDQESWYSPTTCIFLRLNRSIDPTHLENAIQQIVSRHPMLTARFTSDRNGSWAQHVPTVASKPQGGYEYASCAVSTLEEASETMKSRRESLDIEKGPLFVAMLFNLSEMQCLSLAAHALIVDHTSWDIISRDIEYFLDHDVYMQIPKPLPLGFREWCCSRLKARDRSHMIPAPAPITSMTVSGQQPSQRTDGSCPAHSHSIMHTSIPVPSGLLGDAPEPLRLTSSVVLQAAVLHAFSRAFEDQELPLLTVEEDGRGLTSSHNDFSQTVGQFTTDLTLCVQSYGRSSFGEILCQTKESYHRARNGKVTHLIPSSGRQSSLEKSMCAPLPGIRFKFLLPYHEKQWRGAVFEQVVGENLDYLPDAQPAEGMTVTIAETTNGPRIVFTGTPGRISRTDLERWAQQCKQSMDEAVKTLKEKTPIFTPCDFPLLALTSENLQDLLHCRLPAICIHISEVEAAFPCSPIQQGMLISQARQPEHYQAIFIWEVACTDGHTTVDPDWLQLAWVQLTRRHSMLRTIFVEGVGTSPYIQVILKADSANTAVVQCSDDGDARSTLHARRQIGGHGRLSLPRFTVCQTERGKLLVAVEISHVLMDATSMEILKRDLALACDNKLECPTSGAPYNDYVAYLEGSRDPATLKYWSSYLEGCSPCYFPRLNDRSESHLAAESQSVRVAVPFEYTSQLDAFCRETGLTISNVVQVAWGLVLRAFTGLDSVLFGYLTSGRDAPVAGIEDAVGPYINVLICRIDIKQSATLLETAHENQRDFMRGFSSQHLSLTELFHSASDGGHGMFNTCMSFPPETQGSGQNEGYISFQELEKVLPNEYDITVECRSKNDRFTASLVYSPSTLSESQATRIAHTLSQAIVTIIHQSGIQADVPLLSELDRRKLEEWNRVVPARAEQCVHHLIAERCCAQPDAPAVCAWDGDFTYGELDRLSSALAAHLAGLGVRPEVFVPLLFEKSRWTTVAMLGVMKAGGAFVLLDPSHPRARLQSICLAVSVDIAIASASQAAIAEQLVTRVVALGVEEMKLCEKRSDQMTPSVAPNNALYVVFTSGSTGVPKGAIVTHESYSTGALSYAPSLGLTHASRVFQFSSYAFDNSISDILTTLIVGGCVCVPSESARRGQLAIAIQNLKATVCFLTPSVARLLLPDEVQNLSTIILMGEAMTSRDVDQWADRLQLYNEYGPAECSVISTIQRIARKGNDPCNIGRGTGCVSWVVDQTNHDKLLPIGVIGELLIEGPIVGRGYLNNPEQTAATFIDPPAWLHTIRTAYPGNPGGDRVYKTGDLVQYTADGLLRFIGRKDTQVKLRGQRIELGDVEHHVRECFPGARDVVAEVVKPADDERPPMLIAFVWMDRNRDEGMDDILITPTDVFRAAILTAETRLHDAVPVYMVPAVFLPLVAVPLTATGKTDRRRLRERAAALSQTQIATYSDLVTAKRQPSTTAQRILQQLWAQVLNLPSNAIGADDNFFRLGGDSITAMQLAGVARKNGLFLAVTDVFRYNTLATLASRPESPGTAHPEMVDWEEETALDPSLPRADPGHLCDSESISVALTGSTGFLGRELLRQLVTNTQVAYIHCLAIRPGRSLPPDLLSSTKIIPHSGDLSLPRLGLSETEASRIFSSVAAIIHNGADVSRLKSYSLLRGSNVDSTRQLLELSLLSTRHSSPGPRGTPHFHYISTAGVCHLLQARPFSEMSVASFPPPVDGVDGYTAAKWASERILERAAHTLGLQVVIHRPSQITGADVGDRDIWHNIWRWSQVIRAVPDLVAAGFRGAFDLISVEKCGTSIVCSVIDHLHRSADNPVDYVRETGDTAVPVETFGEFLGNEIGITNMPVLPFAEWVERAVEAGLDELVAVVLRQQAANA